MSHSPSSETIMPTAPASPAELAMCARKINMVFGGLHAVSDLDLDVAARTIHAIIGPNGAGKTTAVNALCGTLAPTSGQVWINGVTKPKWSPHEMAQYGLARTFQNIRLFGGMTVLESVLVGGHGQHRSRLLDLIFKTRKAREEERAQVQKAQQLIAFVGLAAQLQDTEARALSYGNQRRVEIARALMSSPKVLVLDEPLAGMNVSEKDEISELIFTIRAQGTAILLIEHDMDVIRRLADTVTVLNRGKKLVEGTPAQVLADAQVQSAYLGKVQ